TTEQRDEPGEHRVDAATDDARDAANGFVYKSRYAARGLLGGPAENPWRAQDVVVHRFDQIGQADRRVNREAAIAAQVGDVNDGLPGSRCHVHSVGWALAHRSEHCPRSEPRPTEATRAASAIRGDGGPRPTLLEKTNLCTAAPLSRATRPRLRSIRAIAPL